MGILVHKIGERNLLISSYYRHKLLNKLNTLSTTVNVVSLSQSLRTCCATAALAVFMTVFKGVFMCVNLVYILFAAS